MVFVEAKVMDSTHLELARPITTVRGGKVFVAVTEPADQNGERGQWSECSAAVLGGAYGDSEPDYTPAMVREPNPDYKL